MTGVFKHLKYDAPASVVVLLVAIPLCLGIALGSNAPLFSGIIAGIVGGIVIGTISGSQLSVSGPAAGLTVIVATGIGKLPVLEAFFLAVAISGIFQLLLGFLKAGSIGDYVPNSVIKGMLAAIGVILILKQFPHLIGYDADYAGDQNFLQNDRENTFTGIVSAIRHTTPSAILIGFISLSILILWEQKFFKTKKIFQWIPGPLVAVVASVFINEFFARYNPSMTLGKNHLVELPVTENVSSFILLFNFPDFGYLFDQEVWKLAFTLAIVASLETLLSIEAVDKLDPLKRVTPPNRELKAQGVGNIVSGLLGGLPVTSVIVRSSANVNSGAKSKLSAILHGVMMLLCVMLIPMVLNRFPLSALAAILIFTGYKLARVTLLKEFYQKGWDQFVPFVVTIVAILLSDLLVGVLVGIGVGLFFMIRNNFKFAVFVVHDKNSYLFRLRKDVSFLNKGIIKRKLEEVPANAFVLIDATRADFIDKDVIDTINEFMQHAHLKNIRVEVKKSPSKSAHHNLNNPFETKKKDMAVSFS
jgi:MFS superfamily sulfate permease-like transporter